MPKVSKNKPLGRGLSSLLGENLDIGNLTNKNSKNDLIIIPIDYLSAGSWQVRQNFDENENFEKTRSNQSIDGVKDKSRKISPLVIPKDAFVINNRRRHKDHRLNHHRKGALFIKSKN